MKPVRFLMIGGFLGAGKTTTIGKLAAHYVAQGKNVALVTNDQAYDLVDTQTLRSQGFHVGEVPGACFCCKFDDLIDTVDSLSEQDVPDLVIAEPVGSCTDLVATVIEPMRELFGDRFETGPLVVLLKPSHGKKILAQQKGKGFSPKAEYIFLKQLEEADSIAINKIDRLDDAAQQELIDLVKVRFPEKEVFGMSARDGAGFGNLVAAAESVVPTRTSMMDVDYEIYAEGEAELGWLNCQVTAKSETSFALDDLLMELVQGIGSNLKEEECEIAHLKVLGQTLQSTAVVNLVSSGEETELSLASEIKTSGADILVNARVAASPEQLESAVQSVAGRIAIDQSMELKVGKMQSFRPGKPVPTHRTAR